MAASKKQQDEIRDWFMAPMPDGFWVNYPADLCGGTRKKGPRGEALKSMIKINPDADERDRILASLKAQVSFDRKDSKNGDACRWPYATTYINQMRWEDTIDSVADIKQTVELGICQHGDCGEKVHGETFVHCAAHVPEPAWLIKARKEGLAKMGLTWVREEESFHEFAMRCKHYCLHTHGSMLERLTK